MAPAARAHGTPQALVLPPPVVVTPLVVPLAETLAQAAARLPAAAAPLALPAALTLGLILASTTPAHAPGLPVNPDELRLRELAAKHEAGTLAADEEAELIALLGKVRGIHVQRLADLEHLRPPIMSASPIQTIPNKFPEEAMPSDGKIVSYQLVGGNIKGVNGRKQFDFIIDDKGNLIIGNKHHALGGGRPVQAAGQLRLNGLGQIRQIDNLSGHYQPTISETAKYPQLLENAGVNVKGATLVSHSISTNSNGMVTGIKVLSSKIIK